MGVFYQLVLVIRRVLVVASIVSLGRQTQPGESYSTICLRVFIISFTHWYFDHWTSSINCGSLFVIDDSCVWQGVKQLRLLNGWIIIYIYTTHTYIYIYYTFIYMVTICDCDLHNSKLPL